MREVIGEVLAFLGVLASLAGLAAGLIMIHPGLALAVAGLAGLTLAVRWLRRDRSVPEVPVEVERRDSYEIDPDDDGRMEVRAL